ncbi:MAG: hypothetical protein Kow0068_21810 [Marinilabiliales bacterium]
MIIKTLGLKELKDFIKSDEFKRMENIPIPTIRAISQINNPRLREEDTILCLAYIDDNFAGYLGALPDDIFIDGNKHHIAWLSCLWVDNKMRGKGIAPALLNKMVELWNHNLFIVNFTPVAKKAYDKTGAFDYLKSITGIRGYIRLNLHQLQPRKNEKNKKLIWFYHIIDFSFNILNSLRLSFINFNKKIKSINIQEVSSIDEDIKNFILLNNKNELTKRGVKELEWIIQYPWLKNIEKSDGEYKKYAFSSVAKNYKLINLKITEKDGKIIGFLMLHIRDREMKIPYAYFHNNSDKICGAIYHYLNLYKIRTLTVYKNNLVDAVKNNTYPFFKIRELTRTYLTTYKLKETFPNLDSYEFQDGDGDSAFT